MDNLIILMDNLIILMESYRYLIEIHRIPSTIHPNPTKSTHHRIHFWVLELWHHLTSWKMNIFICSIHHFDPQFLIDKSSLTHLVPKIKSDIQKKHLNTTPNTKIALILPILVQNRAYFAKFFKLEIYFCKIYPGGVRFHWFSGVPYD